MTLEVYVHQFYNDCANALGIDNAAAAARWDKNYVIELLNQGWARAAEDTLALRTLTRHDLTTGQEEYGLPSNVVRVLNVQLYKDGEIHAKPLPRNAESLMSKDAAVDNGLPQYYSVSLREYDSSTGGYVLRLLPPSDWTETNGLVIEAAVRPTFLQTLTSAPDLPDALGRMGAAWAAYRATGNRAFEGQYHGEKLIWARGDANKKRTVRGRLGPVRGDSRDVNGRAWI